MLGVWFWALGAPPDRDGCNTSLPEGYGLPLAAAHAAAAIALGGLLVWLGISRGERIVLGGVAVLGTAALLSTRVAETIGLLAILAAWPVGIAALIGVVLSVRRVLRGRSDRIGRDAQLLTWAALVVGLPAHYAAVWLAGASPFCF